MFLRNRNLSSKKLSSGYHSHVMGPAQVYNRSRAALHIRKGFFVRIDIESIMPLASVILIPLLICLKKKKGRSNRYLICFAAFYAYLTFVVGYTILPLRFGSDILGFQEINLMSGINLIPFREMSVDYLLSIQGIGNIALGIPFGFGLPFLVESDFKSILRRGLFFTLSIELVQLVISLSYGFPYRTVDINDVMLNLSGVMIGFALFCFFSRFAAGVRRQRRCVTEAKRDNQSKSE
jgi:glycopeptide antibiotics resistance protein